MANPLSDDPFIIVTEKKIKSSKIGKLFNKLKPPYSNFANRNVMAMAVVLLLVGSIGAGVLYIGKHTQLRPKAGGGGVELSISPSSVGVAPTQTFQVDVNIDTKDQQITAAQIKVNYDSSKMALTNTQIKDFLPTILSQPETASGSASFTVAANPNSPKQGTGTLATLSFRTIGCPELQCTGTISLDSEETQVASVSQDTNAVGNLIPAVVSISDALPQGSSSPQPSSSASTLQQPYYRLEVGAYNDATYPVKVFARTDTDAVNLFVVKLNYGPNTNFVRFDNTGSVVTNWATQTHDNSSISFAGGIPTPGIKTQGTDVLITTLYFSKDLNTDLTTAEHTLAFQTGTSMYRNSDNEDTLLSSLDLAGRQITYASNSSPTPTNAPGTKGDGNGDGVVNYQDLSVLLSNWTRVGVEKAVPPQIDFNDDGKINTFDFSAMTGLLVQLGVIHRNS